MELSLKIFGNIENHCFACLKDGEFPENVTENRRIQEQFKKTFNLQLDLNPGFPKFLCTICHEKLNKASEFLAQVRSCLHYFEEFRTSEDVKNVDVKEEEKISLVFQPKDEDSRIDDVFEEARNDDSFTNCSNNESDSDNEPLIKFVPKKKRRKKNTFNPKLRRIPLRIVEEAMEEYRETCKENSNCVLCDFKGLNIRNLSCHMIFKHKQEKNHWCLRCNMMIEDIETHKKTHTNKLWCKFCKKDVTRCHYMEHLKSHAGLDYSCDKCPKKFISQKTLNEHMVRHRQQKPFQCHVCNKSFKLLKSLEDHILMHGRYKCDVCEKNFEIPELLSSHLCSGKANRDNEFIILKADEKSEDDDQDVYYFIGEGFDERLEEKIKNENANRGINDVSNIKALENTIKVKPDIQVESLTCHFCQRTYKTAYKLQKHIEAHMGIFLAKCEYCDKGFSSKADLANHERVHTKEKPFICSTCGKGFVSGATLRIHMKQHTGKPEECDLCHKRFCRKSELKLHLQKHRGERPFLCTDCGKSFAQKSHLTCHLTMHSEERPYSCVSCDKAFKKKELLKHHMKLHGEKRFKCTVCFYECHKKYRLQQHMKMHEGKTGIKMNSCQLCTRTFSSLQLLNIHMSNAHNVIV